jgi:ribosomal protein L40E
MVLFIFTFIHEIQKFKIWHVSRKRVCWRTTGRNSHRSHGIAVARLFRGGVRLLVARNTLASEEASYSKLNYSICRRTYGRMPPCL